MSAISLVGDGVGGLLLTMGVAAAILCVGLPFAFVIGQVLGWLGLS
ncbi:MAG: hypothetical protein OEW19_10410 [Acidobacteriota bacterium]|nr:hypothetical protein [Acidobacteriota bacterium]